MTARRKPAPFIDPGLEAFAKLDASERAWKEQAGPDRWLTWEFL